MPADPDATENRTSRRRWLALLLFAFGILDLAALAAVGMPREWMGLLHAGAGLGSLPDAPVVGYLARSASALYALHGALMLALSSDVVRYAPLIRFLGWAAILHGLVIFGIDQAEAMPIWWRFAEGPCFSLTGIVTLIVQAWAEEEDAA